MREVSTATTSTWRELQSYASPGDCDVNRQSRQHKVSAKISKPVVPGRSIDRCNSVFTWIDTDWENEMLIVKTSSGTLDPYCWIDRWREQLCGVRRPLLLLNANARNQPPPRSPEVVTPHLYLNSSV